jgi:hypothetical protein
MLRIGFLPSDFNPMVLMLGESDDLRLLAGVLRQFAHGQAEVRLHDLGFCTGAQTRVTLTASAGQLGIEPLPEAGSFLWRLDAERAATFADLVDQLAQPARRAGSEMLECATGEGIPVKVSRGEYTDDFLLGEAA